ncbi:MAG: CHAT domain-containing protein [Deltaproteobacteria bacterium]|nr:CHAT domain-containing protein [Deltaproteobacteria bacterium]
MTRTVSLELLRHGKPYNQLLSKLTPYLALTDRFEATTVHLPYEHREFIADLNALRYGAGFGEGADVEKNRETRQLRLGVIADQIGGIFASIPGLIAGLGNREAGEQLTHLRLVFSAAELSLLPFELATAPKGFPGEGNSMLAQKDSPMIITREIRGAKGRFQSWSSKPKVLFAAASAGGAVPWKAHLQALVRALEPWTGPSFNRLDKAKGDLPKANRDRLKEYLTFLPRASLSQISKACSEQHFTHVHILAHGVACRQAGQDSFSLALHDKANESRIDPIDPGQLEEALRMAPEEVDKDCRKVSYPTVVSLATCDSANQAQVVTPASSMAHTLHDAGVSLVVASQFPLTKDGSVMLADNLYRGLLLGEDPRCVVYNVRSRLRLLDSSCHDWASLIVYASLPVDLESQLQAFKFELSRSAINVANKVGDGLIRRLHGISIEDSAVAKETARVAALLDKASDMMPTADDYLIDSGGMIASKDKRKAELLFRAALNISPDNREEYLGSCRLALVDSLNGYRRAVEAESIDTVKKFHWVITQRLSLQAVLRNALDRDLWHTAKFMAESCIREDKERVWSYCTLAELYLLLLGYPEESIKGVSYDIAREKIIDSIEQIKSLSEEDDFKIHSTRTQFNRYIEWWGNEVFIHYLDTKKPATEEDPTWEGQGKILEMCRRIMDILPESNRWV